MKSYYLCFSKIVALFVLLTALKETCSPTSLHSFIASKAIFGYSATMQREQRLRAKAESKCPYQLWRNRGSKMICWISGEKLLCYHGPLLYEAKCMKSRILPEKEREKKGLEEGTLQYFVHYQVWPLSEF